MSNHQPHVVLVHGAFAESASWNGVIERLHAEGITATAAANPLRSLAGDAQYVRDVIASVDGPVVLVGHSYGGLVISEASAGNEQVAALVYVGAFTPQTGDTAFTLSASEPGSTLGDAIEPHQLADGGVEFTIARAKFHEQFAADVDERTAGLIGALIVARLRAAGHDVVAASRATGVDSYTGEGLAQALAGRRPGRGRRRSAHLHPRGSVVTPPALPHAGARCRPHRAVPGEAGIPAHRAIERPRSR